MTRSSTIFSAAAVTFLGCALTVYSPASARTYDGVLRDPVALGAWLYSGNCRDCHGEYAKERPAEKYEDRDELISAIGSGKCRVSWSRTAGGNMGTNELAALAAYMLKWEENDAEPLLSELPPQPLLPAASTPQPATAATADIAQPVTAETPISPPLQKLIESNSVAEGGWLYTQNCYRCHLTYQHARMGKGLDREVLLRTISEGKIATQMKGFSRLRGGKLKSSEIRSIATYITTWETKGEALAIANELMAPPAVDPAEFIPVRLPRFQAITGDTSAGITLFSRNCASCHGTRGEGYLGPSLLAGKAVVRPDLYVKSIIKQGVPGSIMRSWTSGSGGNLSAKAIDDIVSALLTRGKDTLPQPGSR